MLKLDRLTIQYGALTVARDIDAQFEAGNIYTILGANGAGKSSLLKAMLIPSSLAFMARAAWLILKSMTQAILIMVWIKNRGYSHLSSKT